MLLEIFYSLATCLKFNQIRMKLFSYLLYQSWHLNGIFLLNTFIKHHAIAFRIKWLKYEWNLMSRPYKDVFMNNFEVSVSYFVFQRPDSPELWQVISR